MKHPSSYIRKAASGAFLTLFEILLVTLLLVPPVLHGQEKASQKESKAIEAFRQGLTAAKKGDYDEAIADWSEAIRLNPKYVLAYNNLGFVYAEKGDHDKAIAYYDEAIRLNPKYAQAYKNRIASFFAKGEYDRAIVDCSEAIRLNPKDPTGYANRGLAYTNHGDHDKAIADCSEAIRLNPKLAPAYYNRGIAYELKEDHDKAIADWSEAIRLNPTDPAAYNNRGAAYFAKGDHVKAIADNSEAIRLDPQDAAAYNNLALILATCPKPELRDAKNAVEYAMKARELDGQYFKSMDTLAAAYAEAGDFEQAIQWETQFLDTPKLSEKDAMEARRRLALYKDHKAYHAQK